MNKRNIGLRHSVTYCQAFLPALHCVLGVFLPDRGNLNNLFPQIKIKLTTVALIIRRLLTTPRQPLYS